MTPGAAYPGVSNITIQYEKTPGVYPAVFNTVIPYENFYIQIGTNVQNLLKAKDIIGMWRYVHNLFVEELKRVEILDKFGRIRASVSTVFDQLYGCYCKDATQTNSATLNQLAHAILQHLVLNLNVDSAAWTRIYPVDMLLVPILQNLFALEKGAATQFQRISGSGDMGPFELYLAHTSYSGFHIDYDVKAKRNMITLMMKNQYDTDVLLFIKSNTKNCDTFINMVDDNVMEYSGQELDAYLKSFVLSFALTKEMNRKRKLLLSVTSTAIDELKEE